MKKIFSFQGASVVAMGLLLGSCVSQKKYDEAQRTIEQYRSDSAAWAAKYNTVQQSYSTLEQNNKQIQTRYDSINKSYMADQQRWQTYQGYYDQQRTAAEQIHQQLHTALDNTAIGVANVFANGNEVYVNIPESSFFASGSSKLTAKGREALQKLATALKSNNDVEIDVRTNLGTESYYGAYNQSGQVNSWSGNETRSDMDRKNDMNTTDKTTTNKNTTDKSSDTKVKTESRANIGDSGYVGSGTVTKSTTTQDGNKKSTSSKSSTAKSKSYPEQNNATMNTMVSGSTKSSTAKKSKSENWSLHNARLNAIASELSNNGLAAVHVMTASGNRMASNTTSDQSTSSQMNDQSSTTQMNTSTLMNTAAGGRGYQIVVSSSNDDWYDMMNENGKKSSTSINSNKSTGSVANKK